MTQVIWKCPNGHKGVRGPSRPRKDDIRRYCLPCSEASGRLVERISPVMEKKRALSREKSQAKQARKREKAQAYYVIAGVNVRTEMRRLSRLKCFGGTRGRLFRDPPELIITRRKQRPWTQFGAALPSENKIWLSAWPSQDAADVKETLLHEMVHIHVGRDRHDTKHWHGQKFRSLLREACEAGFGFWPHIETAYHGGISKGLRERERAAMLSRTPAA